MPPTSGDKCHVTWRVACVRSCNFIFNLRCVSDRGRIPIRRNLVHGTEPLHMLQASYGSPTGGMRRDV